MTTFGTIQSTIRKQKPALKKKFKVRKIGVFGSWAKGRAKKTSDVDILIELSEPIGLDLVDLQGYLEELLGKKVDLVTVKALRDSMRDSILEEVVYV